MIRRIVCPFHGVGYSVGGDGYRLRKVHLVLHVAANCDFCNKDFEVGDLALALTEWKGPTPSLWELDYGTIQTNRTIRVWKILGGVNNL